MHGELNQLFYVCRADLDKLSCVQSLHEHDFILRSGTPYNFRFRAAEPEGTNLVQICNLSRANQYRIKMSHIADRTRTVRSGAPIFMSLETHRGRQQSRRDDLEVLGYMFMYFLRGGLPWQGFKGGTTKMGEKKDSVSLKSLCAGFPGKFALCFNYIYVADLQYS